MNTTLAGAAPHWSRQPAAPPSSAPRVLMTPAARARLRDSGHGNPECMSGTSRDGVVRLHDVEMFIDTNTDLIVDSVRGAALPTLGRPESTPHRHTERRPSLLQTGSKPSGTPAKSATSTGNWLSIDVHVGSACPGSWAAATLAAAARVIRTWSGAQQVSASVETAPADNSEQWTTTDFADVAILDTAAMTQQIAAAGSGPARSRADIKVVDGSRSAATRLQPEPGHSVLITLGRPQPRVMPTCTTTGDPVIAVADVVEIWMHTGHLDTAQGLQALKAVATAIGKSTA